MKRTASWAVRVLKLAGAMRNIGLVAFGVTTCVLVPAAISRLTAGPQQIGKLVAPNEASLHIAGATIEASLDRAMVDPGDSVRLKLVASEAKAKRIALGVVVYGSNGTEGGRVPDPPVDVAHETVTLDIDAHGKATKEIKLKLAGAMSRGEPFANYTVYVMPPKAADRLVHLRDRSRVIPGGKNDPIPSYNKSGERFMSLYWQVRSGEPQDDGTKLFAQGEIARLEAHSRVKSSVISIAAPSTSRVGEAYTVAVTLKNPTRNELTNVKITLETPAGLLEQGYTGLRDDAVDIEPAEVRVELGRHETKRVEFKVKPKVAGTLGLYARATVPEDYVPELESGAVEATDIVEARESIVSAR